MSSEHLAILWKTWKCITLEGQYLYPVSRQQTPHLEQVSNAQKLWNCFLWQLGSWKLIQVEKLTMNSNTKDLSRNQVEQYLFNIDKHWNIQIDSATYQEFSMDSRKAENDMGASFSTLRTTVYRCPRWPVKTSNVSTLFTHSLNCMLLMWSQGPRETKSKTDKLDNFKN